MSAHSECRDTLIAGWLQACADVGDSEPAEINISTAPPIFASVFTEALQCPHGVTFYIEPTNEQRAKWRAEGVS